MGTGLSLNYSDFLNGLKKSVSFLLNNSVDPLTRPEIPKIQLHEVMESKLGIM